MAEANSDGVAVSVLKELLRKKSSQTNKKKKPSGAQSSLRLFTVPEVPTEEYNEVYPNILLGNRKVAKNKPLLRRLKVTHVINAAHGTKSNQMPTFPGFYEDVNIQFMGIPATDICTYKLYHHFEEAADFIDEALSSEGKVYVHCMRGVSRSATLVIAYLMLKKQMSVTESVREIRSKRAIYPNDGFLKQLCSLNEQLYGEVTK